MKPVRVLVAEDHEVVRIGIESVFATQGHYKVCAQAVDGRAAVEMARSVTPDLILLDIGLPKLNGLDAARQIVSENHEQCVLFFTEIDSERTMREALEAGARGYVLKSDGISALLTAAEALLFGRTFFTSRMTEMVLALAKIKPCEPRVSDREREIIQLVAEGHCVDDIAKMLGLSPKTVDTHRSNIRRKLDIGSTAELILYAVRNEIVRLSELRSSTPGLLESRHALHRRLDRERVLEARTPADPWLDTSTITPSRGLAAQAGVGS